MRTPRDPGHVVALVVLGAIVASGLGMGAFLLVRPGPAAPADHQLVRTPFLRYWVPSDWSAGDPRPQVLLGAAFTGVAEAPGYECRGERFLRGFAASALVVGPRPAGELASTYATGLGELFYPPSTGTPPDVALGPVRWVDVAGTRATLVEATVRTPDDDGCLATEGSLLVLAIPTAAPDGRAATVLLVASRDTAGGPATPPVPDRTSVETIIASARLDPV